ncbi:MAG: ATP-dependent helicase C-terminal domain-containing protein [Vicinamibacteria bacterium]
MAAARERRAVLLVAEPGAGKTTRVPPALAALGPVLLLEPRRIAARAIARRIADEQGFTLGEQVGWQVRFERRFGPRTRLLVATEGILTARAQQDPLLSGFRVVVLDEFHERSIHADLALAFARQALLARDDLALVVMSATLDPGPIVDYLGGAAVVEVPGRQHPLAIRSAPGLGVAEAARELLADTAGHVLCFLPGLREIDRARGELQGSAGCVVHRLHGALDAAEQEAALAPSRERKLILATNVAETSLTVDAVTAVVDSGQERVMRYDVARGLDRLETQRVSLDSATQRAGRAGRTGPGSVLRLWDPRERLPARREPEIRRIDLAAPVLDVLAWGARPSEFEWFERPEPERLAAALEVLRLLGAADGERLTPLGERLRRIPLPPRLGRLLLACGGSERAAALCALLAEPRALGASMAATAPTTDSDALLALDRLDAGTARSQREQARSIAGAAREAAAASEPPASDDASLRRALFLAFPDRVARRREPGSPRLLLFSGQGASLARESGVRDASWLVALDVQIGPAGGDPLVRMASAVERDWLTPTRREVAHALDASGRVRATGRDLHGALVLAERPVEPDPAAAEALILGALRDRPTDPADAALLARLRFAAIEIDLEAIRRAASAGSLRVPELRLGQRLPRETTQRLREQAPETLRVPSGRELPLEYRDDGGVVASVRLQELFGLAESPRLGPRAEPVTFELLAPNGRPVQVTRDLRSFWQRGYPEVRKELRGRYPRHPWPEDPWTAPPTRRAKPRR